MAAANEERLISKVVRDRNLVGPISRGIDETWFVIDEDRAVWKFLVDHWRKYGEVPTSVTVKDNYPNYRLLKVEDSLDYLIDEFCAYRKKMAVSDLLRDGAELYGNGPDGYEDALLVLQAGITKIEAGSQTGSDIDLMANPELRWDDYIVRKDLPGGMRGIPTGIAMIDKATSGLQKGQLITIIAPPKTGKSTLALQVAKNIHDQKWKTLFQSFEMSNSEQESRYDAMSAKISHTKLMNGTLDSIQVMRYRESLDAMKENDIPFYLSDAVSAMTVSSLAAKIQTLKPDVVFVDGVYLMMDEISGDSGTPQALTNITRNLKRLAQKFDIPVVISTQALTWKMKGKKVTADSIGYSSSFYQDSDVIIALERTGDDHTDESTRVLRIVASRNCGPGEVMMNWDWDNGTFAEFTDGDPDDYND